MAKFVKGDSVKPIGNRELAAVRQMNRIRRQTIESAAARRVFDYRTGSFQDLLRSLVRDPLRRLTRLHWRHSVDLFCVEYRGKEDARSLKRNGQFDRLSVVIGLDVFLIKLPKLYRRPFLTLANLPASRGCLF